MQMPLGVSTSWLCIVLNFFRKIDDIGMRGVTICLGVRGRGGGSEMQGIRSVITRWFDLTRLFVAKLAWHRVINVPGRTPITEFVLRLGLQVKRGI